MPEYTVLSDTARAAANTDPAIADALAASNVIIQATIDIDPDAFLALLAPEAMVNNPANMVVPGVGAAELMRRGLIAYSSFTRTVEYLATLPDSDMVVMMGEEITVPKGISPHVGKTVRRRYTDIWRNTADGWKMSVRQATITAVE